MKNNQKYPVFVNFGLTRFWPVLWSNVVILPLLEVEGVLIKLLISVQVMPCLSMVGGTLLSPILDRQECRPHLRAVRKAWDQDRPRRSIDCHTSPARHSRPGYG